MIKTRSRKKSIIPTSVEPLVYLWILRILVPLGAQRKFIEQDGFSDGFLAETLELKHYSDAEELDFDAKAARNELRNLYKAAEVKFSGSSASECLSENITQLSQLVGLSETECRILELTVLINTDSILGEVTDWLNDLTLLQVYRVISVILELPENEIRESLGTKGILAMSGLLSLNCDGKDFLRSKLELLSGNFAENVIAAKVDPISLLRDIVLVSSPPHLVIEDYQHLTNEINVLRLYLRNALSSKRQGVNVFLHGKPGTGKNQLVKILAQALECELFEVSSEDKEGDPINGMYRLRAFRAVQSFFARRRSLILFDEAEDVFNDDRVVGFKGRSTTAQSHKAWINRLLEENTIPTVWLSNSIHELDAAFIRRFDIVIELPIPPKQQRQRIIRKSCPEFITEETVKRIADTEHLTPAVITRAASVVTSIQDQLNQECITTAFEWIVNSTLAAQGHKHIPMHDADWLPEIYDPKFINTDADVETIATGLRNIKAGRLCLYGPSGTGKTAYGHWLAEQLNIPLLVKRGSDLISMWVGETEKNIASAFSEARSEGALLLIDEVDSFLQDRRDARNSWEVTGVNEMLIQMESFPGVFIASTNLVNRLDQAALRRFDLKLRFNFLRTEQLWGLFKKYCNSMNLDTSEKTLKQQISRLINVTPGDFAAIARRHRFNPLQSGQEMIQVLQEVCSLKEGSHSAIGFI